MQQRYKNLLVKTFSAYSESEIDNLVAEFRKGNNIMMMQTHIFPVPEGIKFVYVAFYLPAEAELPTNRTIACPKCGDQIPRIFIKHDCGWVK